MKLEKDRKKEPPGIIPQKNSIRGKSYRLPISNLTFDSYRLKHGTFFNESQQVLDPRKEKEAFLTECRQDLLTFQSLN